LLFAQKDYVLDKKYGVISLGIKNVREGNQCERCKKDTSEVGKMEFYEEHDLWCCDKCIKETVKEKNLKCYKCKKVVGIENMTEHNNESMCYNCKEKDVTKRKKTKERIKFFRKYWYVWFGALIAIIIAILT